MAVRGPRDATAAGEPALRGSDLAGCTMPDVDEPVR